MNGRRGDFALQRPVQSGRRRDPPDEIQLLRGDPTLFRSVLGGLGGVLNEQQINADLLQVRRELSDFLIAVFRS